MDESTEKFLRRLNEQNAAIAAREAKKSPGEDPVRLQREKDRREKWGELRAREHPGKRPKQVRNVFGHVMTPDD